MSQNLPKCRDLSYPANAKRENEPGAYELDAAAYDAIQKAVGEIKDFQPPKK